MSVLLLGDFPPNNKLLTLHGGLEDIHETVFTAGPTAAHELQFDAFRKYRPDYEFNLHCNSDSSIEAILQALPEMPSAVVLAEVGSAFLPTGLADAPAPTVFLPGEDWIHADEHQLIMLLFDLVLFAFDPSVRLYRERGYDNVDHWYSAAIHPYIGNQNRARPTDVSFWGNLHPIVQRRRNRVVEALLDLRHEGYEVSVGNGAFYHDYNDRLNETKIVLHDGQSGQVNMRVIEGMAAGCLVIAARPLDPDDYSARLFQEGEEIVYFDDSDDALDKVRYYAARDQERERIAGNAHKRVTREFTPANVARRLIEDHLQRIPLDFRDRRQVRLNSLHFDRHANRVHYFAFRGDAAAATRAASGRDDPMDLNNLAVAEAMERRFDSATRHLENVLAARPQMAIARANLVAVRHFSQTVADWSGHVDWIDRQIASIRRLQPDRLEPGDLEGCYFPTIYSRFRMEHAAAFRDHAPGSGRNRRLLDLHVYRLHQFAAEAAMFAREPESAIERFRRALEIVEDDGYILANIAVARTELGDVQGALADLELAIALEPFFADAQSKLIALCLHLGRTDQAREVLRKLIDIPMLHEDNRRSAREQLAALDAPGSPAAAAQS